MDRKCPQPDATLGTPGIAVLARLRKRAAPLPSPVRDYTSHNPALRAADDRRSFPRSGVQSDRTVGCPKTPANRTGVCGVGRRDWLERALRLAVAVRGGAERGQVVRRERPANRHGDCGVVSGDWLWRSPRLAEAAGGGVSGRGLCSSARRFREEQRLPGGDAGGQGDSAALCPGLRVPQHPEPGAETQAGEIAVPLHPPKACWESSIWQAPWERL
ncbi:uncharacterized protein LOC143827255 [Paroedura picta]|uniref:uncharacterized protein LOC143827255 n=1 Tax=Paroedura picta TaxID=143630 RepID=UPI0040572CD3